MASKSCFRAMGSNATIEITGGRPELAFAAMDRVADLEAKWSRFLPTSEVSRLGDGETHTVSPDTAELVDKAVSGWHLTNGGYDPTVLDAVIAAGYDRSLELIDGSVVTLATRPAPGCAGITVDGVAVTLPAGVGFDPGGIGKGLAGDVVARELMAAGVAGVMVDLGGDVRVAGQSPDGGAWLIAIDEPAVSPERIATIAVTHGAVSTSTTRRRRWSTDTGDQHHLIDPGTGRSIQGAVLASAIATEGWWAEVQTKALLSFEPTAVPDWAAAFVGLVVDDDQETHRLGGFERFER